VKQLLISLAALFGMVPARRYETVAKQLEDARAGASAWKARATDAQAACRSSHRQQRTETRGRRVDLFTTNREAVNSRWGVHLGCRILDTLQPSNTHTNSL